MSFRGLLMLTDKQKIRGSENFGNRLAPLALWLLLIFLPAFAGKLIFSAAIDLEKQLENSKIRQKFNIELQKYNTALDPETWLRKTLSASSYDRFSTNLYKGQATVDDYRSHPFLSGISDFKGSPAAEIARFSQYFRSFVGAVPDLVFVMAQNEADCGWQMRTPFQKPEDDGRMRRNLVSAWTKMSERLEKHYDPLPERLRAFTEERELNRAAGLFDFVSTGLNLAKKHFSTCSNTEIFISLFPVPGPDGLFNKRFVLAAISTTSLNARHMLKTTCQSFTNDFSRHSFGETEHDLLPVYTENDGNLALIGSTPDSFRKLAWKHLSSGRKPLAIKIADRKHSGAESLRSSAADFALMLYALMTTLVMAGIKTGHFNSQSIQRLVTAGLFAGILLPLSGTTWLGICYMNTRRHLDAETALDWMQNAVFLKDQAIKLQLTRNVLFRNLFASSLAKFSAPELQKLNSITAYYEPESSSDKDLPFDELLVDRVETYVVYHPELDEIIGMNNSRKKITETPHLFFGSHARESLFQLGAMSHMPADRVRQMLNKTQYTMGFLDDVLDLKIVSKVFAEEKSAVKNIMSTRREQLTANLWRGADNQVKGMSILQTINSCWKHDFEKMLKAGLIKQEFSYNGYRIFLHIYLCHSYHNRKLHSQSLIGNISDQFAISSVWPLAEALYAFGDSTRLNNLDAPEPHLIFTAPAADGEVWIMGIAEPESANNMLSDNAIIAILSMLAIICGIVLARGLSRVLLRPIPAFEEAVREMSSQNFSFALQIRNGDEFDLLADSFNQVSKKLHEKAKLSQLVSRNVLDAISSADGQLLRPGGSRVEASILFSDLRGFTTISENHAPEEVVAMLNDYFSLMADIIERNGGLIDKLIGDAIQAVFYAHENKNCAESAAKAGLEMRAALSAFNQQRQQLGLFTIDNGVGICTGSVICGRVGSEHGMLDATIIGSLVNRAAHLESLSKQGKSSKVFIDAATSSALPQTYRRSEIKSDDAGPAITELSTS